MPSAINVVTPLILAIASMNCGASTENSIGDVDATVAPQTREVTVRLGPELADSIVFSSTDDGRLLATARTDAEGTAVLLARDGGMVSFSLYDSQFETNLTTIFDIDTSLEIRFPVPRPAPAAENTTAVSIPTTTGASRYYVFACDDSALIEGAPYGANLGVGNECFDNGAVPIMAFAAGEVGMVAYSHGLVDSVEGLGSPPPIVWKTDFVQEAVAFAVSEQTEAVQAASVLAYGPTVTRTPLTGVYIPEPTVQRPPGEASLLWTELRATGPFRGIQEHIGTLPAEAGAWIDVVSDASVQHNVSVGPKIAWRPTNEGDLVAGSYRWNALTSTGDAWEKWLFVTSSARGEVVFPQLPDELGAAIAVRQTVTFGEATIHVIDYKDIDSYGGAMAAERFPWSFYSGLRDDFLRGGGTVAVASTVALRE